MPAILTGAAIQKLVFSKPPIPLVHCFVLRVRMHRDLFKVLLSLTVCLSLTVSLTVCLTVCLSLSASHSLSALHGTLYG